MPFAKIDVTIPGNVWIADVSSVYPEVTFRVVSTQYDGDVATGLVEIEGGNVVELLSRADGESDVIGMDLLWKNSSKAIVQIETTNPTVLLPAFVVGIPLQTPFVISNGVASWELFTSPSKLAELSETFDELGIAYEVESVQEFSEDRDDALLTNRQQEVLGVAYDAGYYDTPRESNLTQVAESLDVTKATCSDILHRAEGKIVGQYLTRNLRH